MTTELIAVLLSINLAALIALLLHLLGLRLAPNPFELLAMIGGGRMHPQAHTAWRNKVNADLAWEYWSGVRHG